ncbi:MAG: SCP2 sterol-binding domain-containing protein [Caldilineaceae bacterium]
MNSSAHHAQVYRDAPHFYAIMGEVFDAVRAVPANVESISRSNLVIRIRAIHPEAEILVDGRQPPLEVFFGARPGLANIEIEVPADLLHRIWLGKESTRDAFFSGRIKTRGNMLKMLKLTELFYECERVYPAIALRHGLTA